MQLLPPGLLKVWTPRCWAPPQCPLPLLLSIFYCPLLHRSLDGPLLWLRVADIKFLIKVPTFLCKDTCVLGWVGEMETASCAPAGPCLESEREHLHLNYLQEWRTDSNFTCVFFFRLVKRVSVRKLVFLSAAWNKLLVMVNRGCLIPSVWIRFPLWLLRCAREIKWAHLTPAHCWAWGVCSTDQQMASLICISSRFMATIFND